MEICLIGCPGALNGAALEEYHKEAGNRPRDNNGQSREGEKSHILVYEDAEVEEAYACFTGGHCEGVDEVDAPEEGHKVGEIVHGDVIVVVSVAIPRRDDA